MSDRSARTSSETQRTMGSETRQNSPSDSATQIKIKSYSSSFTDKTLAPARAIYFKTLISAIVALVILMFAVFSIYWGALWRSPAHSLKGWVVDFDGSTIGSTVSQALLATSGSTKIAWTVVSADEFPGGSADVVSSVLDEKTWVAVVINAGATNALATALGVANASYDGTSAITVFGNEARNENAFRSIIRTTTSSVLDQVATRFALQFAKQFGASASTTNLQNVLTTAPQILTKPLGYTLVNIRAFDVPVATAITFVGLIYLLILSFFVVVAGLSAREISGLEKHLTTASLIRVRLTSSFTAYFILSLFYSLVSLAFQVDFSRKFGSGGFVLFWMLNYAGMLSVGLALEAMITLLTQKFIAFFMIFFVITNVAVCVLPIQVLPHIYRYGYAMPFYNVSRAVRTILFSTKNQVGMNFGILIAWIAISCITIPLFQWFMRRRGIDEVNGMFEMDEKVRD